mmetsp:Transcript_11152/g.20039  ORF Transcript_11152/g.20039 Transcript_11152/m.20039 type:complete len:91 (-) Transcript_11152:785-1057(-)
MWQYQQRSCEDEAGLPVDRFLPTPLSPSVAYPFLALMVAGPPPQLPSTSCTYTHPRSPESIVQCADLLVCASARSRLPKCYYNFFGWVQS